MYDFDEVQRVALPLYTAGCLLRLRHATAAAGGGGAQPAGLFDDDSDALHLYGAAPDGWGGRNPPGLACCAVLRFGDEGGARVEQLAVAPDRRADGWGGAARRRRGRRAPRSARASRCGRRRHRDAHAARVARLRGGRAGWLSKEVAEVDFTAVHSQLDAVFAAAFRIAMPEKAPPVVHEFWLSSTITECTIDTATQTAEAKFLSKWHFVDKDFANKVKRGERVLVDESGSNVKAEEVSELVEKGDMLRGYMLKMGVDEKNRSEHPSEKFPVKHRCDLLQSAGQAGGAAQPVLARLDEELGDRHDPARPHPSPHCDFGLAFFPYDKHVLPFALETRSWKHNKQDSPRFYCPIAQRSKIEVRTTSSQSSSIKLGVKISIR